MKRNPVLILVFLMVTSTRAMPWQKWKSKGTSRWSIPWRCQSAPAAQKAQTPVPVNLPWTSPACCDLELQASEAYPYAVAHFNKTQGWSLHPSRLDVKSPLAMASRKKLFLRVPVSKMVKDGASNNYVNRSTTAKPLHPPSTNPTFLITS